MKVTLNLTQEHLRLIPFIRIIDKDDKILAIDKETMLTMQNTLLEDVSLILGLRDLAIPNTEDDANGRAFPDEVEEHIFSIYNYLKDNLYYVESLIHQYVVNGGITEGTYVCDSNDLIWTKQS